VENRMNLDGKKKLKMNNFIATDEITNQRALKVPLKFKLDTNRVLVGREGVS